LWVFSFTEVWKDIENFENYQVSNLGRVKRLDSLVYQNNKYYNYKGRILKQENSRGYRRVTLSKNNIVKRFLVHRLVACHFINKDNNKKCVNHINGDKSDNNVFNLEWCTYSENEKHSYNFLNKINANRKLKQEDVLYIKINAEYGVNGNIKILAKQFDVNVSTIYNVLKNKYYV